MVVKIAGGRIITDKLENGKSLYLKDGVIDCVTEKALPYDLLIDANGCFVSHGFIDIHTHGGGGFDFMDGGIEPIIKASKAHFRHGTTSIIPTTLSSDFDSQLRAIADIGEVMKTSADIPNILGIHIEGPYFSLAHKGAQDPKYIKNPCKNEYKQLVAEGSGIIKRWSFAPELDGAEEFCVFLLENGIIPSIAHSDATLPDVKKVYDLGCRLVTHFYSCMSTITRRGGYRQLGVIESAYLLDDMMVEVIADGFHLPPPLLELIYKLKGGDKICLVTDSMRGADMPDGKSILGRREDGVDCIIEDGVAKLLDRSAFAGSVATADRLVSTMYKQVGLDIVSCVKMMTATPAKIHGLSKKGAVCMGYDSDIDIFDDDINMKYTIVADAKTDEKMRIYRHVDGDMIREKL